MTLALGRLDGQLRELVEQTPTPRPYFCGPGELNVLVCSNQMSLRLDLQHS